MLSQELEARGFVHQHSADSLAVITDGEKRTIYLGVDPTADSMHVGNLAAMMLLRQFAMDGHKVIMVIGGGTGMIGDPKPDVERPLTPPEEIAQRVVRLRAQAERLLGTEVVFVNNHDWLGKLDLITFLRDIGKHFTVNNLIKKDAIAARLKSEEGISYTEFAYPLLQAYDYLELHRTYGCDVQIGGSDQWGNITAGVDLIRRITGDEVFALTVPLIIDKTTGKKFGKSEGNAVWLDAAMTSPFQFYQFWFNTADENLETFLNIFTSLSREQVAKTLLTHSESPEARTGQQILAHEVTRLVHGDAALDTVMLVTKVIFGETSLEHLSPAERRALQDAGVAYTAPVGEALVDVLVNGGLASSKREARQFIEGGAITINGEKVQDVAFQINDAHCIDRYAVIKRGKRQGLLLALRA